MTKWKPQYAAILLLASLLAAKAPLYAEFEDQNPFGAVEPPPAPPEFNEEEDLGGANDFGFTPPAGGNANNSNTPPPSNNISPYPEEEVRPNRANLAPPPSGSSTMTVPQTTRVGKPKKPPTKLADYLELDPSVRGLTVKNFDLPDKDIKDVVQLISKWTGKNFILAPSVRGKITIIGPSQVTLQEAYQAFLSALEVNNLTTVLTADGKFIRIIESSEARRAPVKTYSGDYAPKDDQFITRIFKLNHISAEEVQREFRDLTTRQGKLFAYEPTNHIIITDTGSNIQRIKDILESLDIEGYETALHVLRIRNGSSKAIAEMLDEIYGENPKGARSNTAARSFRRSALERTRGGGIISKIIPDEATNSLVVLANNSGFKQLVRLVAKLDVKVTDTGRIHVYYCEYAKSEDLASTLAALASGQATSGKSKGKSSTPSIPGTPASLGGAASAGPVTAELEGGIKVTSDASTNALVITASAADYQTIKRVIKKLDIPRLQVFVETAILELSVGDRHKVGTNIATGAPGFGFAGGFVGDSKSLLSYVTGVPGEGLTLPALVGDKFSGNVGNVSTGASYTMTSFMGLLNLLTANTNSSILSTPQIIAMDNEKAVFKVQDNIPVQETFTAQAGLPGANVGLGTIGKIQTGVEINLTPHVNAASKTVRLEIEQKVDSAKDDASVPEGLRQVQKATTSRVTNTSVVVKDHDYVMLGGLMSDKIDESITKVPLLGDIPILGWLFKSKNITATKTNLVVLLRPRIIGTSLASAVLIKDELKRREGFINDNFMNDTDPHDKETQKIKKRISNQEARGRQEKEHDYRNSGNDGVDEDDGDKKKSRGPELLPGRSGIRRKTDSQKEDTDASE